MRMVLYTFVIFLPNNHTLSLIMRKTRDKPQLRNIIQNTESWSSTPNCESTETRNNYNGVLAAPQHNLICLNQWRAKVGVEVGRACPWQRGYTVCGEFKNSNNADKCWFAFYYHMYWQF